MSSLKRFLCVLLSLMLLVCSLPAFSLAEETEEEEIFYPDELIVGHPTITKGDFFTEMFGNDTADIDVRALIHGYNLVNWDQNQGVYILDPTVVLDTLVVDDEVGNRTYYLSLADDLFYSDGSPITAWDYAFSLLLMMAPEIEQIGGKIYRAEHILGFDEYITGEAPALGGVQVVDDHQLAITLDHEFLPYFFEIGLLLCVPYPISVIAPGCKVYNYEMDGYNYGVYIGNEDESVKEPIFTADLLRETILNPETGYNSHPSVVSGPYKMISYSYEDNGTGHYEINEYFKGAYVGNSLPEEFQFDMENFKGAGSGSIVNRHDAPNYIWVERTDKDGKDVSFWMVKPTIEKIAFTVADNDTLIQELADGEKHLVNKVVYGPTILDGMQNGGEQGIRFEPYPRIGLAFLTFTFDWPTVHDKEVRQAIAWCMDRDKLAALYCGDGDVEQGQTFGMRVDGYYGIEQWEYLLVTHQIDYPINFLDEVLPEVHSPDDEIELLRHRHRFVRSEAEMDAARAAWDMLSLDNLTEYTVDTDKANALLDSNKWTLNRSGETYQPGVDDVRCKMIDGELVALDLTMMYPEGNHIVDFLQENFIDNLNKCGILLTLVPTPMQDLLHSYYRETERTTDMIYLATNFHVVVDPSITYSTDDTLNHEIWNNTYSDDEDLYYRAVNMRKTEPLDVYDYVAKWVSFQERYNEVLPTIPVYSNIYFDFYTDKLQNYHITGYVTWSQAILAAYFGEATAAVEEPEEAVGDDEMIFE